MLAHKDKINYADINHACHKFPETSKFYGEIPRKNNVNPDHLYNGTPKQNAEDSLNYSKAVKLTPKLRNLILKEAPTLGPFLGIPIDYLGFRVK